MRVHAPVADFLFGCCYKFQLGTHGAHALGRRVRVVGDYFHSKTFCAASNLAAHLCAECKEMQSKYL